MGKSTPQAPTPPDPVKTAQAQAQYNQQAAITQANLDRIDQYTPQGSLTYQQIGTNSDGTPQYKQTQTYSPEQQALYDQQNQIAQALGNTASNQISRVDNTMGADFNYNGMTPLQTGIPGQPVERMTGPTPQMQTSLAPSGSVQTDVAPSGAIQSRIGPAGNIQTSVGPQDLIADGQRVSDALYQQAASRLDPQYNQQQSDLDARLAAQGIARGSEAANREQGNLDRSRNDAYNQANYSAIQAGGAEQSRLFGLDFQKGQFANSAQAQQYDQNANDAQFGNAAQQQGYAQNAGNAQFHNAAQDQRYSQNLETGEFTNNANLQQQQVDQARAAFNNQAGAQEFNQNLQDANMNNNARQEQIQEASYLRNLPLNDIAALLGTGGGVQNPTFSPFAQVGVAAPDYMGQVNSTFNAQQNQYNQQQANRSQMLGSIFGLAGTAATAFSDRRLKGNIVRIGTLANGLATYAFNYIGDKVRQFGVMAQDALQIVPDAVTVTPSGYMAVDYGKVW